MEAVSMTTPDIGHVQTTSDCDINDVDDDDDVMFENTVRVAVPIVFGLITVVGLVGNPLYQSSQSLSRYDPSPGLTDLVFIVICVPFTAMIYVLPVWPFGTAFCKIYQYVIHVTAYASVYTLVLMSLDRYLAVVHPIRSLTIRTRHNAGVAVSCLWVVVVLANSPMLQHFSVFDYSGSNATTELRSTCLNVRLLSSNPGYGRFFYGTFFAFGFVLPMTLICVLYALLLLRLLRRRSAGAASSAGRQYMHRGSSSETTRARRRVTTLVVIVVAAFGACWLPIHLVFIVQYFVFDNDESAVTHTFVSVRLAANCLAYANSCLNPILYAFLSENFRSALVRLFPECRGRGGNVVVELRDKRADEQRDRNEDRSARPLLLVVQGAENAVSYDIGVGQGRRCTAQSSTDIRLQCFTEVATNVETAL